LKGDSIVKGKRFEGLLKFMGFCCTSLDSCEQVICTIVVLGALVTVGLLLAWHVYLLLHNKTTIEVLPHLICAFPYVHA
jgi:hypothetical protein